MSILMPRRFPRWPPRRSDWAHAAQALVLVVMAVLMARDAQPPLPRPSPVARSAASRVAEATRARAHEAGRGGLGNPQPENPGQRTAPTPPPKPSAFAAEQAMSAAQRVKRWNPFIAEASKRFEIPESWIRAVMQVESGGRTMSDETTPITSSMGAMGLMQLMPDTYDDMRHAHGLGADPYDPHDNIMAGTAYLRDLRAKYGYPAMFAAYNDGPGHLDQRIANARLLPTETVVYVERVTGQVEGRSARGLVRLTRPDGSPILVDGAAVRSVRSALPGEYAPGVKSVITVGTVQQGVREDLATARSLILVHGGAAGGKTRVVRRLVLACARDPYAEVGRISCERSH